MESRDNASVFLSKPHVITFGTIFLAGLRSDEGMISVLAHELMHIADGDNDS
jgi:predicted Zn-dependent protease